MPAIIRWNEAFVALGFSYNVVEDTTIPFCLQCETEFSPLSLRRDKLQRHLQLQHQGVLERSLEELKVVEQMINIHDCFIQPLH